MKSIVLKYGNSKGLGSSLVSKNVNILLGLIFSLEVDENCE
jgi:hypothetical protein